MKDIRYLTGQLDEIERFFVLASVGLASVPVEDDGNKLNFGCKSRPR
jgi:hypothetical protein